MNKEKEKKKEYTISFVEEVIQNPKYKGWVAGRMEVLRPDESAYSIDEIRFFTPRTAEWIKFVYGYDCKDINKAELDKVTKIIKERFYKVIEGDL